MLSYDEPIIEQVVVNVNDPAVTSSWCRIKKDLHGTQPTDVQQLKTEIAAPVDEFDTALRLGEPLYAYIAGRIEILRQLSAV